MVGFPTPFGSDEEGAFDESDAFVPENIPEPGAFLAGQNVLTDDEHVAFHETTRHLFEKRTVYDMTFGYNLARLNLDSRHEDAGYRYAEERSDPMVLRAEFAPTTPFCPQSGTLTVGSFRAWNGLSERHSYDIVRVRVDEMHNRGEVINERLRSLEEEYRETGEVGKGEESPSTADADPVDGPFTHGGPDAPF
jgi:hypothetical protein